MNTLDTKLTNICDAAASDMADWYDLHARPEKIREVLVQHEDYFDEVMDEINYSDDAYMDSDQYGVDTVVREWFIDMLCYHVLGKSWPMRCQRPFTDSEIGALIDFYERDDY